jgi:hypothetical protein
MTKFDAGCKVVVAYVDRWAFNGRERHPTAEDLGFVGVVVTVEECEACEDEDPLYAYLVCRPSDGKLLELMSHEVEPA